MTDPTRPGGRPFHADELGDADPTELQAALRMGRVVDGSIDDVPIRVPQGFTGRVMAAVNEEPAPGTAGFMLPIRRRGLRAGFSDSVRQAWAAIGSPTLPTFARAAALSYVLAIALAGVALAGAATAGVGSALGILGPGPTPTNNAPTLAPPAETLAPPSGPSESDATETDDAHGSPDASDDHGGAGGSQEPGDDGGNSGPGSSGSGSGGGGGGGGSDDGATSSPGSSGGGGSDDGSNSGPGSGGSTPRPSQTPRPSDTPRPTDTPKPSETAH